MGETETIFKEFKEHSVAEFFKKNKQMLGFSGKTRSLTTIVHELVTNSLDACEEAKIAPEISVEVKEIDKERYIVKTIDNGPGIPEKHLGKALGMMLAGTKFHRYCQQRGQQGIGASGVTMYSQITTGKPIKAVSGYDGTVIRAEISVDFKSNSPRINNLTKEPGEFRGLSYECEVSDAKYDKSSYGVYEYLKRTAIANPHSQITLLEPDGTRVVFPRSVNEIPPKPQSVQPHPMGISTNDLMEFAQHDKESRKLGSFLQNNFARVSAAKVEELAQVAKEVDFNKAPKDLQWNDAEAIIKAIKLVKWIAPATDSVKPIGEAQITKSLTNMLSPEHLAVVERSPKIYSGGIPFVVEAAVAYGGQAGRKYADKTGGDIMRFANRAPLLFDSSGCGITEAIRAVDWKRYNIRNFDEEPITVLVNISSVHIPYTGAGKQAISDDQEVYDEVKNAVMEAARNVQRYIAGLTRDADRKARRKAILRYVTQLSKDLVDLANEGKAPEIEKELIKLIEEKYSAQIEDDDSGDEEVAHANENRKDEGGEEGEE